MVTYLTFMVHGADCWSYGVQIPVGKRNLFVIYRPYLINAMLLYVEFIYVCIVNLNYSTLMHLGRGVDLK